MQTVEDEQVLQPVGQFTHTTGLTAMSSYWFDRHPHTFIAPLVCKTKVAKQAVHETFATVFTRTFVQLEQPKGQATQTPLMTV